MLFQYFGLPGYSSLASNLRLQTTASCWAEPLILPRTIARNLHAYQKIDSQWVMYISKQTANFAEGYSDMSGVL